ncbi:MAG: exopolyphosphatase [Cyclobacteriaceae bacterium]
MNVAVIDMGTNTFHLIIVELEGDDFRVLFREKVAVKIGENGINQGMIIPEAQERAITTLKRFKKTIEAYQVEEVSATATSAIRNAHNGKDLVDLIEKEAGFKTRIISGIEEANYIYFGVKRALKIGPKPQLIMDIGGGSIEFIIGTDTKSEWMHSFEIGGLRLLEKFHKNDPITSEEISSIEHFLEVELDLLFKVCEEYDLDTLIGSSGTFDTLSDIFRLNAGIEKLPGDTEYPLPVEAYRRISADLIKKTRSERMQIPGMIELRVEMIVVATILINYVVNRLNIKHLRVSAYALKEGVLLNTIQTLKDRQLY